MILLHAGVCDNRLLLWAEMSPKEPEELEHSSRQGGAKPRARMPAPRARSQRPLPYDAGKDGLAAALEQAGLGISTTKGQTEATIAWLPTLGDQPIASSPLIAEPPRASWSPVFAGADAEAWVLSAIRATSD